MSEKPRLVTCIVNDPGSVRVRRTVVLGVNPGKVTCRLAI
jgi:hypothetical protein